MTATTAAAPAKTYTFRDPVPLARVLVGFLWADLGVRVFDSGVLLVTPADPSAASPLEGVLMLVSGAAIFIVFLSAAFLSLKWCYRVQMNAHAISSGLSTSPPWAVGWFFVPIMNLFKPFQAVKEAWQASRSPSAWAAVQLPGVLGWWWGSWIISNIVANIAFRLSMSADGDLLQAANTVGLVSNGLTGLSDILFIQVVTGLSADQRKALENDTFA